MVNLSRRFKLEYNDSNNNTQVIAETGQDTGALKIDRHVQIRRTNDPDILKVWLEGSNFGNSIPTRKSEFGTAQNSTDEPEILYKQYDRDTDSFVTQGRYYAKNTGTINEDGELALKLYSFMRYTSRQSVSTGTITTDIEGALNAVLPTGYVADVPVTPPSVSNYSLNARREKGYQELTRNYNYALTFTSELDANNDYKVKFEPVGQGGSVDTLDSSTDPVTFKSWEKDKTDSIVNKVTVEGTDSTGATITATATNQSQIDNFGEKFRKFKVGYLEASSEAQEIAESYLVPGLNDDGTDITTVPESGTVKTVVYTDNIVNDSINVIDSVRNINDTYTVVQQRNYWPEGASELEFEFEQENLEEAARDSENLRDERARLYPSDQNNEEVGNQDFTGDTGSAPSDTAQVGAVDEDPSDTSVTGSLDAVDNSSLAGSSDSLFQSEPINSSAWDFIGSVSASTECVSHILEVFVTDIDTTTNLDFVVATGGAVRMMWTSKDVGSNNTIDISAIDVNHYMHETGIVSMSGISGGQTLTYDLYVASQGSNAPTCDFEMRVTESNHSHTDNYDTQDNQHPHGDNFDTDDFNHGGSGDATGQHGTSGTTDPKTVSIDAAQEDKTDR